MAGLNGMLQIFDTTTPQLRRGGPEISSETGPDSVLFSVGAIAVFSLILHTLSQITQPLVNKTVHRTFGIVACGIALAGGDAGQALDPLVDGPHGPDMELPFGDRLHHLLLEHEVLNVAEGNHDALLAAEVAKGSAHLEEPFYLFVDASYGLHVALLIDRARNRDTLSDGQIRKGRE